MKERADDGEAFGEAADDGVCAGPVRLRRTRRPRRARRRSVVLRVARIAALALFLVAAVFGALLWRLNAGPLSVDGLTERVAVALESQFGQGYDVEVRH